MKKSILSIIILGSFGLYVLWQGQSNQIADSAVVSQPMVVRGKKEVQLIPIDLSPVTKKTVAVKTPVKTVAIKPIAIPAPKKQGLYTDGTYTGSSADAYYGNVQVEAVISNGKLTDVQFLDYPQDRSTSRRINSRAMPSLTQEAIVAQSANVNGVSGASDTSAAFKQSLASALSKARV